MSDTPNPTPRKRIAWTQLLGAILILAAAAHYIRSSKIKAASRDAARTLAEAVFEGGVTFVGVSHTLEGMDLPPVLHPCDLHTATNLLASMAKAEPMPMPKGSIDGDLFTILVKGTNETMRAFRAIRPASEPSNAYIGVLSFSQNEQGERIENVSAPARVPEAGTLLGDILKTMVERGTKISEDPNFHSSFSNLLERAASQHALPQEEK